MGGFDLVERCGPDYGAGGDSAKKFVDMRILDIGRDEKTAISVDDQ